MNIQFPSSKEKECLQKISKKQNRILSLIMKIALTNKNFYHFFYSLYFEIRRLKKLKSHYFSSQKPVIPNFMIIGFPKAGTTSLHEYLAQHPKIIGSWMKETHFFSYGYKKGMNFYSKFYDFHNGKDFLYFESSPEYIYYPQALARIKKINPKMKFIVCLRNPIEVSYSSFNQLKNMDFENKSFENVLLDEDFKLELHKKRLEKDIYTIFYRPIFLPYLYISEFSTYIKNAFEIFDQKNFFFVDSEDLKTNSQKTMDEIFKFLGVDSQEIKINFFNKGRYSEQIPLGIREKLVEHFKPFNEELEKLLNKKFNWK